MNAGAYRDFPQGKFSFVSDSPCYVVLLPIMVIPHPNVNDSFVCISVCLNLSIYNTCVPNAYSSQNRSDFPELELQMAWR